MTYSNEFTTLPADPNDMSRPLYGATFGQAVSRFFKRYAQFSGRSSRSEYWWAALATTIFSGIIGGIMGLILGTMMVENTNPNGMQIFLLFVLFLVTLFLIIPAISITVRRLHDANYSGWLCLLYLVPYAGSIAVFILTLLPSKPSGARFDK